MGHWWWGIGLGMAVLGVLQGLLIGLQTWEHRRFARGRLRHKPVDVPRGKVALLVPCRGWDVGLEENLGRLFHQAHENYEVWFIVEDRGDPIFPVVQRVMAAHPHVPSRVILAGRSDRSGQKVHNLRAATEAIPEDIEYLAFVDADARPGTGWLRTLLGRLDQPGVGAATGYRWFVPERPTLANHLLYSLNCNIALLYSRKGPNTIWGGSWAIRRDVFEALRIRDAWDGTLSDDLVANRTVRRAGLHVEFEPACMVGSPLDMGMGPMFSFLRRQYLIGRFYFPLGWMLGFVLISYANLLFLGALAATAWGVASGTPNPLVPASVGLILYALNVARGLIRADLAVRYLPDARRPLAHASRFDAWAGPLVNFVGWLGLIASAFGRQITWRGISYRIFRGGQIRLVRREDPPADAGREASFPSPNTTGAPGCQREAA